MVLTVIASVLRFTLVDPQISGEVIFKHGEKPILQNSDFKTDFEAELAAVLPYADMNTILRIEFPSAQLKITPLYSGVIQMRILGKNEDAVRQSFKDIFAKISELEQRALDFEKLSWERKTKALSSKISTIEFSFPILLNQENVKFDSEKLTMEDFLFLVNQYHSWKSERSLLLSLLNDINSMKSRIMREPKIRSLGQSRLVRIIVLTFFGGLLLGVFAAFIVGFTRYLMAELDEAS